METNHGDTTSSSFVTDLFKIDTLSIHVKMNMNRETVMDSLYIIVKKTEEAFRLAEERMTDTTIDKDVRMEEMLDAYMEYSEARIRYELVTQNKNVQS